MCNQTDLFSDRNQTSDTAADWARLDRRKLCIKASVERLGNKNLRCSGHISLNVIEFYSELGMRLPAKNIQGRLERTKHGQKISHSINSMTVATSPMLLQKTVKSLYFDDGAGQSVRNLRWQQIKVGHRLSQKRDIQVTKEVSTTIDRSRRPAAVLQHSTAHTHVVAAVGSLRANDLYH